MNIVNRILVVLTVLVTFVICVAVFVFPIPVLDTATEALGDLSSWLETGIQPWVRITLGILLALIWAAVCAVVLFVELFPRRRRSVRVERVDGGEVEVSLKTVEEHISYEVDRMRNVLRSRSSIAARKDGVLVKVDVTVSGGSAVPAQATQVVDLVRRVVEEKVGVKLARPPKVHLRAQPIPVTPTRAVPSSPPPADSEPESSEAEPVETE
jgi:hypothetical protein